MTQQYHIVDSPLPLELDFKALKTEGLAYIQKHSGTEWTNLNPSDPGVTILEQLCYAFTELGYCINFPIKDILTNQKGELAVKNQFFKPENILTTSPITIDDYIKIIIDQISGINNVLIEPVASSISMVEGLYNTYLAIDVNYNNPTVSNNPFLDTYFLLNSCRNIGEVFTFPQILAPKKYTITGDLELENGYDLDSIIVTIIQKVNAYVFPQVTASGYDQLKEEGAKTNEIFNGPKLQKGWIPSSSIKAKKDTIHSFEITKIIQSIEGVSSIMKVTFYDDQKNQKTVAVCGKHQLLTFDFTQSLHKKASHSNLNIYSKGKLLNEKVNSSLIAQLAKMQEPKTQIDTVAAVKMAPNIPTGKYRDIANYYSIQNTFPEAYAVGENAINDNTPDYEAAQSRQLKGYLTLFDQLLTNQFAQLANLDMLFSFKNSLTGDTLDTANFFATKDTTEKRHLAYPAPFISFSPTYFYQSLYQSVPNIKPLLKNNNIFGFGPLFETEKQRDRKSWNLYQEDPYNSYIHGLMMIMEDEQVNLNRRNKILDHLLARHGVSPMLIDTIIYDDIYSGEILKDQVIIKSIYLQNFGILSYNRTKAYDFFTATKLTAILPKVTDSYQEKLKQGNLKDLIFDTAKVAKEQLIKTSDCTNYATIELEVNLLLALDQHYKNYIATGTIATDFKKYYDKGFYLGSYYLAHLKRSLAKWLLTQRKGVLCIELNLLFLSAKFQIFIKKTSEEGDVTYLQSKNTLTYYEFISLEQSLPKEVSTNFTADFTTDTNPTEALKASSFKPIGKTQYAWTAYATWGNDYSVDVHTPILDNNLVFIFPDFIPSLNTLDFKQRLDVLLDNQLPIQVQTKVLHVKAERLSILINHFSKWHNDLIYNAKKTEKALNKLKPYSATSFDTVWYSDLTKNIQQQTIYNEALVQSAGQLCTDIININKGKTND